MARPLLMAAVTSGVIEPTSSLSWRTWRWLSWLSPAWAISNLMNTCALPSSFSARAPLPCKDPSASTACKPLSNRSRWASNSATAAPSSLSGASASSRPRNPFWTSAMRASRSPALPDWPMTALICNRSLRDSRPRRI